ncbi:MAG: hypothetical protein LLF84_07310 [Methanoregulaceae archaeon]|nr:hypothetical protein [Methanoregulaceae archaeon]
MKKLTILVIALTLLAGFTVADLGLPATPETQGIVTSTTIYAVGNLATSTELQWRGADNPGGLLDIPPLAGFQSMIAESVYTEDTQTNGNGLVEYDKELDVETSAQITGQWNIEAVKELIFVGIDGARGVSSDSIMIDAAGTPYLTDTVVICPFAPDVAALTPSFCNRAEAGSTVDMTVANVRTTTRDRFVMAGIGAVDPSSGSGDVELDHEIRVTELVTGLPSSGTASAYLQVLVQEGGNSNTGGNGAPYVLMERIEFDEETSVDGSITLFEKMMHYESGLVR